LADRKPADLDENDWHRIIKNTGLMYGWRIDTVRNTLTRAAKPAFQLRKGLNMPNVSEKLDLPKEIVELVPEEAPEAGSAPDRIEASNDHSIALLDSATPDLQEWNEDWDGHWWTDAEARFDQMKADVKLLAGSTDALAAVPTPSVPLMKQVAPKRGAPSATPAVLIDQSSDVPCAIPNFRVTDNSTVSIVTTNSAFLDSMAENHFSASSIEA
jgi:hypothetical protein